MIFGSVVLVVLAAALAVAGLYHASGTFFYSSIVISVLAAFALVVGVRQARPRLVQDDFDLGRSPRRLSGPGGPVAADGPAFPEDAVLTDDAIPTDEPAPQRLSAAKTLALARLSAPVCVVDGRPRYHLPDCAHLLGRHVERLPVAEAMASEFTPCGHCQPATRLLASRSTGQIPPSVDGDV